MALWHKNYQFTKRKVTHLECGSYRGIKLLEHAMKVVERVFEYRLPWYGHVLQKEDNDWVKKCMEYEVEGSRPRGRPR